jgi:uncharacterized protein YdhG (YjbR/CyaY superfamily)
MKRPATVDEYLKSVPKEHLSQLKQLRAIIKAAAPMAEEKISYGMPYYGYKGRLAYFRLATKHLGLFIPGVVSAHKKDLKGYSTSSTATVRFPLNKKLPAALIKKLVKTRLKANEHSSPKRKTAG